MDVVMKRFPPRRSDPLCCDAAGAKRDALELSPMKNTLLALVLPLSIAACSDSHANAPVAHETAPVVAPIAAKLERAPDPLRAEQRELLDLAFDAASSLPKDPHAKTRARLQETVAQVELELGAFERAKEHAARIDGWRRGSVYAEIAFERARASDAREADACLELARAIANAPQDAAAQEWPRDRVRAKIARAELLLGRDDEAAKLEHDLAPSESNQSVEVRAMRAGSTDFDTEVAELDAALASSSFDTQRQILEGYVELHARFYADRERRELLGSKVEAAWTKLPLNVRIDVACELADAALAHDDRTRALDLVERGHAFLDEARWAPEDELPLVAHLATRRHRAGDAAKAREELDAALATYANERAILPDVERADVLRAIAEAFQDTGDATRALATWARAVEEGVANPNARPRAEDLVLTCCSIAKHGAAPTKELSKRLAEVRATLREPW